MNLTPCLNRLELCLNKIIIQLSFVKVQITPKTSTNITRYLHSSYSPRPRERLKTFANQNFGKKKTKGAAERKPF